MSIQQPRRSRPTDAEPEEEAAVELPLDEVFDVLSNERRRRVLHFLLSEPGSTTLGDLAEHIASYENEKPVRALSSNERKRVYICLYQCHLPKMDEAGVVDFDGDRKTVEAGPTIDQVVKYLPAEPQGESKRHGNRWRGAVSALLPGFDGHR